MKFLATAKTRPCAPPCAPVRPVRPCAPPMYNVLKLLINFNRNIFLDAILGLTIDFRCDFCFLGNVN